MAALRWTAEAVRWLEEIHDYIAHDNPAAAHRTVSGIYDRVQVLATFPDIGQRYDAKPEVGLLLHGRYRVACSLAEADVVEILGIFHDALPTAKYLR